MEKVRGVLRNGAPRFVNPSTRTCAHETDRFRIAARDFVRRSRLCGGAYGEPGTLGVRNALKDLSERATARPEEAEHIFDKAVLVEDALRDWHAHFPRDPWIPKYAFSLAQLYGKLDFDDARVRRNDTLDWLTATFPESQYAQLPRD